MIRVRFTARRQRTRGLRQDPILWGFGTLVLAYIVCMTIGTVIWMVVT